MDSPSAVTIAAADLLLAVVDQLAASRHPTMDDIRQGAAEVFGAERLAFRLRDDAAVAMLRAASDELSTIAARPEQRHRLLELRRELDMFLH
jgi:hypothetical protein